jgi:formiminoglutamase
MIKFVKPYSKEEILRLTRHRSGEEKIGESVDHVKKEWFSDLSDSPARFVILGIAEDIGVRANYGRAGASTAFKPALESFLSQQHNAFLDAASVFVLGEVMTDDLMAAAQLLDTKREPDMAALRALVAQLDERVSAVVKTIVGLNKIPLIIGGGHNNAYGNIKGASEALQKKIHVINCDPHLDFRPLEGRHSGNGFSYAREEGFLEKYAVLAMHEQYNNATSLLQFRNAPGRLFYNTYESIFIRQEQNYATALKQALGFVKNNACGVELDLDAITNVPSSAKTSSGLSPTQARQYVHQCAVNLQALYLHIAEGAPVLSHIKADNKTGKLIAYLLSDFIKGVLAAGDWDYKPPFRV